MQHRDVCMRKAETCGPSARMFFWRYRHRKQHWRHPLMQHQFRPHDWYNVGHVLISPRFLAPAIPCYPKRSHIWPSGNIHAVAFQSHCISCLALGDSWIKRPCITTSLQRRDPLPTVSRVSGQCISLIMLRKMKADYTSGFTRFDNELKNKNQKISCRPFLMHRCTVFRSAKRWQAVPFSNYQRNIVFFCILKTVILKYFFPFVTRCTKWSFPARNGRHYLWLIRYRLRRLISGKLTNLIAWPCPKTQSCHCFILVWLWITWKKGRITLYCLNM